MTLEYGQWPIDLPLTSHLSLSIALPFLHLDIPYA